jgi:coenzyme F420-reducing hydrogenase delta subunit
LSVAQLRDQVDSALASVTAPQGLVVFGCERSADAQVLAAADNAVVSLPCIGMLPPSLIEYALRGGAAGVVVYGCRSCEFRLGKRWTEERMAQQREPHLRLVKEATQLRVLWLEATQQQQLATAVADFRQHLASRADSRPLSNPSRNEAMQ